MGATCFVDVGIASSAKEAFDGLVEEALYDHGHSGYTGTIAEKPGFVMRGLDPKMSVEETIEKSFDENDKWGPADCFEVPFDPSNPDHVHALGSRTCDPKKMKVFVFCGAASC